MTLDNQANTWVEKPLYYNCRFGEIPVFSKVYQGLQNSPNIFENNEDWSVELPREKAHVCQRLSVPTNENLKPSIGFEGGYIKHVIQVYKHYFVETTGSFETYCERYKGKSRNSLNRKIKKVINSNKEREAFRIFSKPEEVDDFLNTAKAVSQHSYQEKLFGRVLSTKDAFSEWVKEQAQLGFFRGYILYAEDQPIAYNLCPIYGDGILFYDWTGYDPKYSKYSPGTVLQYKIIENAFNDEEINYYDLCTGEGRHKAFFMTGYKDCFDVYYFPFSIKNFFIVSSRFVIERVGKAVSFVLKKLGLIDKIKKIIRRSK
ncbi:GNAT family N-acetyltransferase [Aliikangiella marina]|uniref:GNAT family N-acetyltransferase n=1 Tax=Aliikangiella marina TaxID=1712262 RepID=A0A545TBK9_9GAMM|nr:GNAT family N-acetyltransferase [Aliikangiella marina]TQV74586.1 GNAT family N-acetyltransferase [Aliikangiella marina]